jgi:hypothetical protein
MSEKYIKISDNLESKGLTRIEIIGLLRFYEKKIWLETIREVEKMEKYRIEELKAALSQIAADTRELHPAIAEIATKALEGGNS